MGKFFSADHEDIRKGMTTDIYFERTVEILRAKGLLDVDTRSEFTVASLPTPGRGPCSAAPRR